MKALSLVMNTRIVMFLPVGVSLTEEEEEAEEEEEEEEEEEDKEEK